MNYAVIKKFDIANGPGVRVSLFVSGCRHHCKNCFNKEAWDFDYGYEYNDAVIDEIIEACDKDYITGLSLLGGEPFEPENQRALLPFVKRVREVYPDKNVWGFTGYTLETLWEDGSHPRCEVTDELLSLIDVLVDGRFEKDKKNLMLKFRGSENQRLIDRNATRTNGSITMYEI